MQTALTILIALCGVTALGCAAMLVRNQWVFQVRVALIGTRKYDLLPSYNAMMLRFWVWDVNKFLPMSERVR